MSQPIRSKLLILPTNNNPVSGILHTGDLLITEIMYDPVYPGMILTGEWFEIYNNTGETIDLHHLVIRKNDTNLMLLMKASYCLRMNFLFSHEPIMLFKEISIFMELQSA